MRYGIGTAGLWLGLFAAGGCGDAFVEGSDDGAASTDAETSTDDAGAEDEGGGADQEGGDDAGEAEAGDSGDGTAGESTGEEEGDGGDGDEDGDEGGGDDGAYPDEVLDHLDLPYPLDDYAPELPAHFQTPTVQGQDNTPADNPLTNAGATLGRVLFYDVSLSANDTVACVSCHAQPLGFSDDLAFSVGFEGGLTGRNSMNLANARYYDSGRFFWDERAATLEAQVLMPIQDTVEMGLTLDELVDKVDAQPYYPELFERAFGDPEVTSDRISKALAQYVRAIVSFQTRFDDGVVATGSVGQDFPNFTEEENRGKQLFFSPVGNCGICHMESGGPPPMPGGALTNQAIFMLLGPANNGLDAQTTDEGAGNGAFKAPSLRNIEVTGPYMHDGRFETLAEVIEHYDNGVQAHPNLDPRLLGPGGTPQQLGLTAADKDALEAFLRTLTDDVLADDPKFSDPFRP